MALSDREHRLRVMREQHSEALARREAANTAMRSITMRARDAERSRPTPKRDPHETAKSLLEWVRQRRDRDRAAALRAQQRATSFALQPPENRWWQERASRRR